MSFEIVSTAAHLHEKITLYKAYMTLIFTQGHRKWRDGDSMGHISFAISGL